MKIHVAQIKTNYKFRGKNQIRRFRIRENMWWTRYRKLKNEEDELVNGIQKMIDTINSRFSSLMDEMNFAGEVGILLNLNWVLVKGSFISEEIRAINSK